MSIHFKVTRGELMTLQWLIWHHDDVSPETREGYRQKIERSLRAKKYVFGSKGHVMVHGRTAVGTEGDLIVTPQCSGGIAKIHFGIDSDQLIAKEKIHVVREVSIFKREHIHLKPQESLALQPKDLLLLSEDFRLEVV